MPWSTSPPFSRPRPDGAATAWQNLDRSGTHVHDVAGGMAVLAAGGGVAIGPDGEPLVLRPDTEALIRLVAAPTAAAAEELRGALTGPFPRCR